MSVHKAYKWTPISPFTCQHGQIRTLTVQPETATKKWHRDLHALFLKAGLPEDRPHQLRDMAAVEWLNAGIPLEEISRLLGHASVRTTEKHYAPWVKSRADRIDVLIGAPWAANQET